MYALAFLIGIIAGLRTMTAPAAISWACWSGRLALEGGWLAFLGYSWTPWIFTVLALGEFIGDQLPLTPSRAVPMQFGARLLSGAICGAAIAFPHHVTIRGLIAGLCGAVVGTLGVVQEGSARGVHRRRHRDWRCVADIPDSVLSRLYCVEMHTRAGRGLIAGRSREPPRQAWGLSITRQVQSIG
jgi:uncharacterized membrane protein